jgi:hypothetical protein
VVASDSAAYPGGEYSFKGYGPKGLQGCVSRTILKLSHSPHDLAHSSTCRRHCTAAAARSGRPGLGREAVQRRLHSSAAQPLQAMKEAAVAVLVRHDVDRPARASSASSESGSLELLLTLHASVGATTCGAQTGMAGLVQHATRCKRRQDGDMHAPHGRVPVKVAMSYAAGPDQRRATRVRAYFGPYPVL